MNKRVPFINRKEEIGKALQAVREWDSRQIVFISGEGGVGKTRFLGELLERVKAELTPISENQKEEKQVRLGLLILEGATGWGQQFLLGCHEMADGLGFGIDVVDANEDLDKMTAGFGKLMAQKPDAILVDLGRGQELERQINKAIQQGVHVISVASNFKLSKVIEVAQDEFYLAMHSLRPMFEDLDGKGKIAVCWNSGAAPLEARHRILDEELQRYPQVQVVGVISSAATGKDIFLEDDPVVGITSQTLALIEKHPDLKAVWASTGEYALGVMRALEQSGRNDIALYSIDFDQRIHAKMTQPNSPWKLTVASDPAEIGRIMVRVAARAVYGENLRDLYYAPISVISRELLKANPLEESLPRDLLPGWGASGVAWNSWLQALADKRGVTGPVTIKQDLLRQNGSDQRWLILNVIDLDDVSLQSAQGMATMIIKQIGAEYFRPYLNALQDLHKLENKDQGQYVRYRKVVENIFLETLGRLSFGHRSVLVCDTTDAVKTPRGKEALSTLLNIMRYLSNAILIISGRDVEQLRLEFEKDRGLAKSVSINLEPFKVQASREYFDKKQTSLNLRLGLSEEEIEKIIFLSRGLPVQIDLAVDWLSRDNSRDWLDEDPLDSLKKLSTKNLEERRKKFEQALVKHIERLQLNQDRLALALAWVNPIDKELCAQLLDLPEAKAAELLEEVRKLSFIKSLPDGRIKLHDYVQDMVLEYVWTQLETDRRNETSQLASEYYANKMSELRELIQDSQATPERETLFHGYMQLGMEWVRHSLYADPEKGIERFAALFDEAAKSYHFHLRGELADMVWDLLSALSHEDSTDAKYERYPVVRRYVQHLVDSGQYQKATLIANTFIDTARLTEIQQVEFYSTLSNIMRLTGNFEKSYELSKITLDIAQRIPSLVSWIPRIQNNLGLVTRFLGNLEQAEAYYRAAMDCVDERTLLSSILNNLSYVVMLQGDYDNALKYCQRGLEIRKQLKLRREVGISHSTLGEIYRNQSSYQLALTEYDHALAIFENENDVFWMSQIYVQRGSTYRLLGRLEDATNDLSNSLSYGIPIQAPWAYHSRGNVYADQKKFEMALAQFELSKQVARQLKLNQVIGNNLLMEAEIHYKQWEISGYTSREMFEKTYENIREFNQTLPEGFLHHRARIQRLEADLFFDEQRYAEALPLYKQAYAVLGTRRGGYGTRTFDDELNALKERIVQRLALQNKDLALSWCRDLRETWNILPATTQWKKDLVCLCDECEIAIKFPNQE